MRFALEIDEVDGVILENALRVLLVDSGERKDSKHAIEDLYRRLTDMNSAVRQFKLAEN